MEPVMYIVLIGPQGSGKGTQASRLAASRGLLKISTGDLLRAEKQTGSSLGRKLAEFLDAGELVPDEITIAIVDQQLDSIDRGAAKGAVFDGFPRNRAQAKALDAALAGREMALDRVFEIRLDEQRLVDRLSGRRVCSSCGATYHTGFKPPRVEGICDVCGGTLEQRADDTPEAIRRRLHIYQESTAPLIDYYRAQGLIRTVDGDQAIEAVERDIAAELPVVASGTD
jgi:adenylate kinase